MTIDYTCDPQTRLIGIDCSGDISIEDRVHFISRLLNDPNLPAQASILIDLNEVSNAPVDEEIPMIGVLIDKLIARFGGRVALVNAIVGHVTLSHLVALSIGDGHHNFVRVFTSKAEAYNWLAS